MTILFFSVEGTHEPLIDEESFRKVRLLVDSDLQKPEYFACHPMINTSSVRFKTSDLFETLLPALHHEPTFVELHGED